MKSDSSLTTVKQAWKLLRQDYDPQETLIFIESRGRWEDEREELKAKVRGRVDGEYLLALAGLEFRHTEQLALNCARVCCEIWKAQRRAESPAFFDAIWEYCLRPILINQSRTVVRNLKQAASHGCTNLETDTAVSLFQNWLAGLRTQFKLRIDSHSCKVLQQGILIENKAGPRKPGPHPNPMWTPEFTNFVRELWRENQNPKGQVRLPGLTKIASALDAKGYVPPALYLEKMAAKMLSDYNSSDAGTESGPIRSWEELVKRGTPKVGRHRVLSLIVRGMRRMLSRIANARPE